MHDYRMYFNVQTLTMVALYYWLVRACVCVCVCILTLSSKYECIHACEHDCTSVWSEHACELHHDILFC